MKFCIGNVVWTEDESRPVWGAWIEISTRARASRPELVAPRMGRVD